MTEECPRHPGHAALPSGRRSAGEDARPKNPLPARLVRETMATAICAAAWLESEVRRRPAEAWRDLAEGALRRAAVLELAAAAVVVNAGSRPGAPA